MDNPGVIKLLALTLVLFAPLALATFRYYSGYLAYGTGDTIIQTWHNHGGSRLRGRKWIVECMDGEGLVGIQDWNDDFEKLQSVWCKFLFPYKPPAQGVYPYYPSCFDRNMLNQWFCYNTENSSRTIDTFITALWDNEYNFYVYRAGGAGTIGGDDLQPYKCCKVPLGYYIDYLSCYYEPTHDPFFEYYDSTFHFIVYCGTGYVMTGIAKKVNPFDKEIHIDWIQCCRVGFGERTHVPSPILQVGNGRPTYVAQSNAQSAAVPASYRSQYRTTDAQVGKDELGNELTYNRSERSTEMFDKLERMRSMVSVQSKKNSVVPSIMHAPHDLRDFNFRSSI